MYAAFINVPGYLPEDDNEIDFDTAQEAWNYLLAERKRSEQDDECVPGAPGDGVYWSRTVQELDEEVRLDKGPGTVYGRSCACGNCKIEDLGLAYSVEEI